MAIEKKQAAVAASAEQKKDKKDPAAPADKKDVKPADAAAAEAAAKAAAEEEAKKKAAAENDDADGDDDDASDADGDESGDDDDAGAGDDDWRARMAGDDADLLKEAQRYDSEESLLRALVTAKKKLRERAGLEVPKADASVEEKAKFYSEHFGRPEKVEDVKLDVTLPDGEELTEAESLTVKQVTGLLHAAGVFGDEQMAIGRQIVADLAIGGRKELEEAAGVFRENATKTLEKKWKKDYQPNLALAQNYMAMRCEQVGVDPHALANVRLENGALLGDDPLFLQVMSAGGREHNEDPGMLREEAGGAKAADLKDALDKEMAKRNSANGADRRYYDSAEGKARRAKLREDLKRLGGTGAKPKR